MATLEVVPKKTKVVVEREEEYSLRLSREEALHLASVGYSNFSADSVVSLALRPLFMLFALDNPNTERPLYGVTGKSSWDGFVYMLSLSYDGNRFPYEN